MSDNSEVRGQQTAATTDNDYNVLQFVIQLALQKIQTATLVKVIACSNTGDTSAVGTVTVQPLVNQMTAKRQAVPHGQIYNLPYLRVQGGANAIIIDPEAGDIGIGLFCSRDISAVKATKAQANPGSLRMFNWSDGLYVGGVLNGVPTQYLQFLQGGAGINIKSPGPINLNGAIISAAGEVTDGLGKVLGTHTHSGVQSGGSNTGPPT